tara:strand:- start:751 stop:1065 length:315 start_codon:yes stop_codon:yes gene_type:complete
MMNRDRGSYFPVVLNPAQLRQQTKSGELQVPFFFGGSQIPNTLNLPENSFSGSGRRAGSKSMTHKGDKDFTTKRGDKVYHQDGHYVELKGRRPYKNGAAHTKTS